MEKNEEMELLNINEEEYKFIESLKEKNRVFNALMTEDFRDVSYTNECELIIQNETLKIIKYNSDENQWKGNSFVFFKSIDFTSSIINDDGNFLILQLAGSKIFLEFDDADVMFECYKELTRRCNMQHQRKFI